MDIPLQLQILELFLRVPNASLQTAATVCNYEFEATTKTGSIAQCLNTLIMSDMLVQTPKSRYNCYWYNVSDHGLSFCKSFGLEASYVLSDEQEIKRMECEKREEFMTEVQDTIMDMFLKLKTVAVPTLVVFDYLQLHFGDAVSLHLTASLLSRLFVDGFVKNSCNGMLWNI